MPTQCRFIFGTCLSIGALLITAAAQQTYNSQLHRFQTETVATGLKQPSDLPPRRPTFLAPLRFGVFYLALAQ
jgi:hypothetical protein